jgi:transcriptional regulator with XRE-family HTH domain
LARSEDRKDPRAASDIDRLIGSYVRARRLEIIMSQEKLADAIGVTFQQIQKYEKGINRISASALIAIARALGVQVSALLPKGEALDTSARDSILEGSHFPELAAVFARLNDDGRKLLIATARALANEERLKAPRVKARAKD